MLRPFYCNVNSRQNKVYKVFFFKFAYQRRTQRKEINGINVIRIEDDGGPDQLIFLYLTIYIPALLRRPCVYPSKAQ